MTKTEIKKLAQETVAETYREEERIRDKENDGIVFVDQFYRQLQLSRLTRGECIKALFDKYHEVVDEAFAIAPENQNDGEFERLMRQASAFDNLIRGLEMSRPKSTTLQKINNWLRK